MNARCLVIIAAAALTSSAVAQTTPGVSENEIRFGQTQPYSGPVSALSVAGKVELAFFRKLNEQGGVNGRKVTLISLDDGFSPPKTFEQTRKLVESENVVAIFASSGTGTNSAIHKYLNQARVPQLFVSSGAAKWDDPKNYPWTIGWFPSYKTEAAIYAKYIRETKPNARIGILYQNDDFGKDYIAGLRRGLGPEASKNIVAELAYQTSDPSIDSQIISLKAAGADTFLNVATPKFAAQAIRKAGELGWNPLHFVVNSSTSVASVLRPAGLEHANGLISAQFLKDPSDPTWASDKGVEEWRAFMVNDVGTSDLNDLFNVSSYSMAQTLVYVLKQAGSDLSRERLMREAANIKDLELPMLLPGIKINTNPDSFAPIKQMQLMRFDGTRWVLFGPITSAE